MNQAKVLGLRDHQPRASKPTAKTKVTRSFSSCPKHPSVTPQTRNRSNSSVDSTLIAVVKPRSPYFSQPLSPSISEVSLSLDRLQVQPFKSTSVFSFTPAGSEVALNKLQGCCKSLSASADDALVVNPKGSEMSGPGPTSNSANKTGLNLRQSRLAKKELMLDTGNGGDSWAKKFVNSKYFWIYVAIDKLAFGAMISYLIHYIQILMEELRRDRERAVSWWQWMATKIFDKFGIYELICLALVIILSKFFLKSLDILNKRVEFLHEEKTQGDQLLFQERMKKLKTKFKTEKWKAVSESITNLVSNIVTTVVNALIPTDATARILISFADLADRRFNRKGRKCQSPPTTPSPSPSINNTVPNYNLKPNNNAKNSEHQSIFSESYPKNLNARPNKLSKANSKPMGSKTYRFVNKDSILDKDKPVAIALNSATICTSTIAGTNPYANNGSYYTERVNELEHHKLLKKSAKPFGKEKKDKDSAFGAMVELEIN